MRRNAARRARERAEQLYKEGLLNSVDYERSEDDRQTAELELKNAAETLQIEKETLEFELHNRRLAVERQASVARELQRQVDLLRVTAPFDGMVATINVQDRDAVGPNQAILTVVDLSAFEVEFDVPENYATDWRRARRPRSSTRDAPTPARSPWSRRRCATARCAARWRSTARRRPACARASA